LMASPGKKLIADSSSTVERTPLAPPSGYSSGFSSQDKVVPSYNSQEIKSRVWLLSGRRVNNSLM